MPTRPRWPTPARPGGPGEAGRPPRRARLGVVVAAGLTVMALALPKGCAVGIDARRADVCRRALPAIVPPGARAEVLRVGDGAQADSVRVDYRLTGQRQPDTRQRWVVCTFGPGTALDAVTTEGGPMSGASVYLLRHYYLDTPEAAAADPGGH